jgi:cellobiose phosphorylase
LNLVNRKMKAFLKKETRGQGSAGSTDPWHFDATGRSFVLQTPRVPRPWTNVSYALQGKAAYYSLVDQAGSGPVFARDSEGHQTFLTGPDGLRTVYFRDDICNQTWTIAEYPAFQTVRDYSCTYTAASTTLVSSRSGLTCSQRIFVPLGCLHEIWTIAVTNNDIHPRTLSIFPYSSVGLDGFPVLFRYGKERMRWATWHPEIQGLFAKNRSPSAPSNIYAAFLVSSQAPVAATGQPDHLFRKPFSVARPDLSGPWSHAFTPGFENVCLCLRLDVTIMPGDTSRIDVAFGTAAEPELVKPVLDMIRSPDRVDAALNELERHYEALESAVQVETGEVKVDRYINHWAPKQIESYLTFKQAFRDNLQADMSFATHDYNHSLDNLLDALSHQYEDGHAPHSFRPIVPLNYSDKPSWILLTLPELIKESGDLSILERKLPFLDANDHPTSSTATVLEHLVRAMRYLATDTGIHGMNRMHYADWLDGLDGLSRVGDGESVLSTLMFASGLLEVIKMAEFAGLNDLVKEAAALYERTKQRLNEVAWEGDRFLRGFSGNGEKVGSKENKWGQLFLNSQSWAVIAGIPDASQRQLLFQAVDQILDTPLGRRLYYPPYEQYQHHIGCISAQPPDYAMNAVYNHACAFSIVADCLAGRGDEAWACMMKLLPDSDANPVRQSQNEPFSLTNSFKLNSHYYGHAGDPWRTNTAAWCWRALVEFILGVRRDYGGLRIDPCLPGHLRKASVMRRFRGAFYTVLLDNSAGRNRGVRRIWVNGTEIAGTVLPIAPAGSRVKVEVQI